MPTRNQQATCSPSLSVSRGHEARHADSGSVKECYEMAQAAFDLAEQLQTPVFVMSDLDLGMNNWMSEPFAYPDKPLNRGKILSAEDLTRLGGFARYKDVDNDGVDIARSQALTILWLPTSRAGPAITKAQYTERPDDYFNNMERLSKKFETARTLVPRPEVVQTGKSGRSNCLRQLRFCNAREPRPVREGIWSRADYLRLRAYPFSREVHEFVASHDRVYVIEQNRDAQMLSLLKLDLQAEDIVKCAAYDISTGCLSTRAR